ncbi:MAG: porphobilinogen synthase [Nitrospirae bacterium]|nr:porphobilinogen synthase [Nitrospirota bacterium]
MYFPKYRLRRLRGNKNLQRMVRETKLFVDDLVMPFFVREGKKVKKIISSMPGNYQLSVDNLVREVEEVKEADIPAVLLFGIPDVKDEEASSAYAGEGIVQRAVRAIKDRVPGMIVITDVCLCEYMSHGHCGIIKGRPLPKTESRKPKAEIDNEATRHLLARTALSHVRAGADVVAPSAMMDGQVSAIRGILDENGYQDIPIMSYSAKYASSFYGPFREAAESPPAFGDRRSYQMDMANSHEALREVALDIEEGADIVMVKPALGYMDIIYRVKEKFGYPVAAYSVSGEFAMVKAAVEKGWLEEKKTVLEILTGLKRAGADIIITYWAKDVARWLKES